MNEYIEIGAEIVAAEFIFPEQDFMAAMSSREVSQGGCSAETIVRLKRGTRTTHSYAGLAKRVVFGKIAKPGSLDGIQWRKLEERVFGEPLYKSIIRRRRV